MAERDKQVRFTTLLHHVYNVEHLKAAYVALKRDAAAGVDGETWGYYGVPMNGPALFTFCFQVGRLWCRTLRLIRRWRPPSTHLPSLSPEATWRCHLRQEPSAVIPLAGICGGGYE